MRRPQVRPTPRSQPLFLVPFCASFFDLTVLDNFDAQADEYNGGRRPSGFHPPFCSHFVPKFPARPLSPCRCPRTTHSQEQQWDLATFWRTQRPVTSA